MRDFRAISGGEANEAMLETEGRRHAVIARDVHPPPMAGRIHLLIQELLKLRGKHSTAAHFVKANLALSGIDPDAYDPETEDDEEKVRLLEKMLNDYRARHQKD